MADVVARSATSVRVRTTPDAQLRAAPSQDGVGITPAEDGALAVTGLTLQQLGDRAFDAGVRVHELTLHQASLEQACMELTADAVEHHGAPASRPDPDTLRAGPRDDPRTAPHS